MKKTLTILKLALVLVLLSFSAEIFAQFEISAQLRPRAEYRHGYSTLPDLEENPAFFVSQRTRINFNYGANKFKIGVSLQDVRTWGDNPQLNISDNNSSLHQAWGQYFFTESFSIKAGRQEIIYDDSRIFGNVDWAQQGRSHDAAILRFSNDNIRIDGGFAWNQIGQPKFGTNYNPKDFKNYKTFQYIWAHKNFNNVGVSILFLNNGMERFWEKFDPDTSYFETYFSQTVGTRVSYKGKKVSANGAFYYQGGKDARDVKLSAMYAAADIKFSFTDEFAALLGFEFLSGTSERDLADTSFNENNSFTPLYGTNHKFNGHMDYFYVGNHVNNVGLRDLYLSFIYKKNKFSSFLTVHKFCSAATIIDLEDNDMDNHLGVEADLGFAYQLAESLVLKAGYSHMFASETMEVLKKKGDKDATANWAWVMLSFSPSLLKK